MRSSAGVSRRGVACIRFRTPAEDAAGRALLSDPRIALLVSSEEAPEAPPSRGRGSVRRRRTTIDSSLVANVFRQVAVELSGTREGAAFEAVSETLCCPP